MSSAASPNSGESILVNPDLQPSEPKGRTKRAKARASAPRAAMVVLVGAVALTAFGTLAACSSDPSSAQAVDPSAGPGQEGEEEDSTPSDDGDAGTGKQDASSGKDAGDAGAGDAGPVTITEILGTLEGTCGVVRAMLTSPSPALVTDHLVFVNGETYAKPSLSAGGQKMFDTPNAGGSSGDSEVMSFEVLHYCEGASLLKTETEVTYAAGSGAITDILVEIDAKKVGVSVTRSYKPSNQTYTDDQVKALLEKKLNGIIESSGRVLPADKWVKQILHVFTANPAATAAVERVYPTIAPAIQKDTIVLVTETKGGGFIYCSPQPALGSECP